MFDTLFGAEFPLAVKFFIAFVIVLGTDRRQPPGWCAALEPSGSADHPRAGASPGSQ